MKFYARLKTPLLFILLVAIAFLSYQIRIQVDITQNVNNTLSETSQKILANLTDKIEITAYVKKESGIRRQIEQLIEHYRYYKSDINLTFVDPSSAPEKIRELGIGSQGGIIIKYQGRAERLVFVDEVLLTNALLQLASDGENWISFLSGHGERAPDGEANADYGLFGRTLLNHKIRAQSLNLANIPVIPDNINLLVLSAPAVPLMDGELALIKKYIDKGGNLLILNEPNNAQLGLLLAHLGVRVLPGVLVDGQSKVYGIDDPSFVLASEYPKHNITKAFQTITIYPTVSALEIDATSPFDTMSILQSGKQSWTEIGQITGRISFDEHTVEKAGPLSFAYALTRQFDKDVEQRIIIVGDGDFLSNTYIGNVGNLDMGLKMVNWLTHNDKFVDIPAKVTKDGRLQLSKLAVIIISFSFLIVIPLLLLVTGIIIWRRRNRR